MKEIIAIIRMNKVNATKKALADIGVCGLHAMKVMGRGKMSVDFALIQQAGEEVGGQLAEGLAQGGRLIPKRLITILVPDGEVEKVVNVIIDINKEGHKGDGKIFVAPCLDAVRVRTGEQGDAAI